MFSCGGHLVEVFVAQLAGRFAAAFFFFAEDADLDAGGVADRDEVPGDLLVALVEGGVAADEVEDVDVRCPAAMIVTSSPSAQSPRAA